MLYSCVEEDRIAVLVMKRFAMQSGAKEDHLVVFLCRGRPHRNITYGRICKLCRQVSHCNLLHKKHALYLRGQEGRNATVLMKGFVL